MHDRAASLARRHQVFGTGAELFYEDPVHLARGEGVWLYDVDGTRYLDLYNNVPCVGHGNTRVARAVGEQMARLNTHSRYVHERVTDYAERLLGLHHDQFESMVMACSGTEAVEVALRMAQAATGRRGFVCTDSTYHGNSALVGVMTNLPAGSSVRGIRSIATPERFRPPESGLSDAELCDRYIAQLEAAVATLSENGDGLAAMVMCSIFANEGLPDVPDRFFERAVEVAHSAGGLVIADEVQAGFARSGNWWGYETSGFEPDIVAMGKPMGNGIPVSAAISSHEIVSGYRERFRYFNTFAGSPVQAAAGGAVLDEIVERDLTGSARRVGAHLRDGLIGLQTDHPQMGDVRGHGLFLGVDWVEPGTTTPDRIGVARIVEALKARGMLAGVAGQHDNVLKIRPPLVMEAAHADLFLTALDDALDDVRP